MGIPSATATERTPTACLRPSTADRTDPPRVLLPCRRGDARASQPVERKPIIGSPHAIDHHAADHEKRHGDADLHHRRDAMRANALGSAAAGIGLQRRQQAGTAEANGRQQSEEHTDHQAEPRRNQGAGRVEVDLRRNRDAQPPSDQGGNAKQHDRTERAACDTPARSLRRTDAARASAGPRPARRGSTARALAWRRGRASCPEILTQTISSTAPARLRRTLNTRSESGRPAAPSDAYGSTVAALNWFVSGYRLARRRHGRRHQPVGLREGRAWMQPAVNAHPFGGSVVSKIRLLPQARMPFQRNHQQRRGRLNEMEVAAKVLRRDPDDGMRHAVDHHGFPDDVGIGGDPARPEVMAQDDARLGRRGVIERGVETGSTRERHAERCGSSWATRTRSRHEEAPSGPASARQIRWIRGSSP